MSIGHAGNVPGEPISKLEGIDPLISNKEACCISISTSYGAGPDQIFLDSPKAEWLWEYAQDKDVSRFVSTVRVRVVGSLLIHWGSPKRLARYLTTALMMTVEAGAAGARTTASIPVAKELVGC